MFEINPTQEIVRTTLTLEEPIIVTDDLDAAIELYLSVLKAELRRKEEWGFALLSVDGRLLTIRTRESFQREFPEFPFHEPKATFCSERIDTDRSILVQEGMRVSEVFGEIGSYRAMLFADGDSNTFFVYEMPTQP